MTFFKGTFISYINYFIVIFCIAKIRKFYVWQSTFANIYSLASYDIIYIFSDKYYWMAAKNTLIFAVSILLLRNILALLLALCLTDKLKTRNFLRTIFYIPSVLSYIVVGILFTAILKSDGLLNRFLSALGFTAYIDWLGNGKIAMVSVIMLDVWMWTGFLAAIYIAGLQAIPRDYYEAARIDGANGVQQFFAISLPMLAPSLQICITLSLVGGIGAFEQILVLTNGGPGRATNVIRLLVYQTFSQGMYGKATAMELSLALIIFLLSALVARFFSTREVEM